MEKIIETLTGLNAWSACFRVFLALLLGGLIGLERGHHGRAAGLRTHILVCLGAALAAMVGLYTSSTLEYFSDPLRVGAQVVSGIGFLGVGTIMVRDRKQVTGLTTAAGLWTTASIGLAIGVGFYIAAIISFAAVLITMEFLIYLEKNVKNNAKIYSCYIELNGIESVGPLYETLKNLIADIQIIPAKSGLPSNVGVELKASSLAHYEALASICKEKEETLLFLPIRD